MHPELGAANPNPLVGKFVRFKIDPKAESTEMELPVVLSEVMGEMARCDDRYATKPYKHAYGIVWGVTDFTGVAHINTETGVTEVWHAGDNVSCAEPCFSPKSADAEEGDGFLIVCVRDGDTHASYVAILDALDIKKGPICLIQIPFALKISAHGTWVSPLGGFHQRPSLHPFLTCPDPSRCPSVTEALDRLHWCHSGDPR